MGGYIGRVPVELDPYTDVPGSAMTDFDRDRLLLESGQDLKRQVHAVETEAGRLQDKIDQAKLARLDRSRAEVVRVRDVVAGVFADLLAALPPQPEAQRERLLDRLRGR